MGQFRSDMLRRIYNEALRQGWTPSYGTGSNHIYATCPDPDCHYRETFTLSGRGKVPETTKKIVTLRRHGFTWQGRGGKHTAERLGAGRKKVDA